MPDGEAETAPVPISSSGETDWVERCFACASFRRIARIILPTVLRRVHLHTQVFALLPGAWRSGDELLVRLDELACACIRQTSQLRRCHDRRAELARLATTLVGALAAATELIRGGSDRVEAMLELAEQRALSELVGFSATRGAQTRGVLNWRHSNRV